MSENLESGKILVTKRVNLEDKLMEELLLLFRGMIFLEAVDYLDEGKKWSQKRLLFSKG